MQGIVWTHAGIEDECCAEINRLIGQKSEIVGQALIFPIKNKKELCKVCYASRTIRGAVLLIKRCGKKDLEKTILGTDFSKWIKGTFAARVKRLDSSAEDITDAVVGEWIKTDAKVDLDKPDTTVAVIASSPECFIGIDFAGIDLGKRDYKIFSGRQSLKGSLAAGMLNIAEFGREKTMLDPFGRDGVIAIEAGLWREGKSPHYYSKEKFLFNRLKVLTQKEFDDLDNGENKEGKDAGNITVYDSTFHNVSSIKKNAKIAGVHINVSRIDIDWLDIKLDEESVDCIVSYPPQLSARSDEKSILKLYNELFHQAEYTLRKGSKMVIAMRSERTIGQVKTSLKLIRATTTYQGEEKILLYSYQKL